MVWGLSSPLPILYPHPAIAFLLSISLGQNICSEGLGLCAMQVGSPLSSDLQPSMYLCWEAEIGLFQDLIGQPAYPDQCAPGSMRDSTFKN